MNIYVLFSLLLFLAPPGGCPIYSIDLSTLEVPNNDFQNELTLRSMLNSELHQYRNELNKHSKIIDKSQDTNIQYIDDESDLAKSIEEDIKATYYGAAETDQSAATLRLTKAEEAAAAFDDSLKVYRSANEYGEFLGTNLFASFPKRCFSIEDIALLAARRDFEALLPKSYPQRLLNDSIVYMLMKYFNRINQIIKRMSDDDTRRVLQRAFYDTLGGYLRYYILPIAHVSYYAGRLKLCTVERLVTVYRTCKFVLNTNGNGWKAPSADILSELSNVNIDAIKLEECVDSENDAASCALLDQSCESKDAENEKMIVSLPSLEPEDRDGFLNNIFLPFKSRRIYNLQSPNSASILVKFFKAVTNCYRFQGICPKVYNLRLRAWIRECVQVHYKDELFYPGLGGVLQIYEYLNSEKKSQKNEQNFVNGQDAKDYPISLEEIEDEGVQCSKKNKNMEKTQSNVKKNNTAVKDVAKQPRSSDQYNMATQLDNGKIHTDENGEQCVECDDSSYVIYIAGFLAILLLVLLALICCCMRRRRNKERKPRRKPKRIMKSSDGQPVELPESVRLQSASSDKDFTTRTVSNKTNKAETEVQKREATPTGLGMMSYHDESYALFNERQGPEEFEEDIEQGSYTSTSSLACQLPRKFIPLPFRRDKQRDYYALKEKPEKVRRKSKRRTSVWEKHKLNAQSNSAHSEKGTQAREALQDKEKRRAQQKKEDTQTDHRGDEIIESKAEAALERQKGGGCNVPVKHASSWETTFEDDDNSSS